MKRTSLARRNALLSSADVSWGVGALAFALLALLVRIVAPNLFFQAVAPAFRAADVVSEKSHAVFSGLSDASKLAARNEALVSENAALANENRALREKESSIGALSTLSSSGIIAGVVARPPASPYDTLVLSQGSSAGVALGQEAFGAGGVPLGIVSSVRADFSRVTLFSAPTMVTDGWVGQAGIPLVIYGAGAGAMRASLARSAGIVEGDIVFALGPGKLPIGTVVRVDGDPSSPSVALQIQPALNLFAVSWIELRDTGPAFAASLSWATSTPL
ncbi:MAG: rod shape-determining protein MreC [Candidatus Pacebacteria bacterium]|nr:rod shape-determining protein MreC [Candidatus Paceibacterota bacterium]